METVYLSNKAGKPLMDYLKAQGYEVNLIDGVNAPVYESVSTHADIYMCQLGLWEGARLFKGNNNELKYNYPGNIIYNAVCTGKYFVHNLKYTHPRLLKAADDWHAELLRTGNICNDELIKIDVSQGYTRCCCLAVDDRSFITSDKGIAKAMSSHDTDVLLITGGHIVLQDFDYGFIGGCSGHIMTPANSTPRDDCRQNRKRTIVFNGDIYAHPDGEKIADFIRERNIKMQYFAEYSLEDIGSIIMDRND